MTYYIQIDAGNAVTGCFTEASDGFSELENLIELSQSDTVTLRSCKYGWPVMDYVAGALQISAARCQPLEQEDIIAEIKREAGSRIETAYPMYRQLNAIAAGDDSVAVAIQAIRDLSNALEVRVLAGETIDIMDEFNAMAV